jgi:hypothetical protein
VSKEGFMAYYVSPHYLDDHFGGRYPQNLSFEEKVAIFADSVRGWHLDIAELTGKVSGHSGFAVLSIVVSYFEMVAKNRDGFVRKGKSEYYFKEGLGWVFPSLSANNAVLHKFYESIRCGLYHEAGTGAGIELTGDPNVMMQGSLDGTALTVNPFNLVRPLQDHFSRYVLELLNPSNAQLRKNFEKRFDHSRQP